MSTIVATGQASGEFAKIAAFLRRDLMMALSYRAAFVADAVALLGQAVVFSYVGRLVDPSAVPGFGGKQTSYLAFVSVGLALTALLQVGLTRLTGVIGSERFMGTLESVLVSPTRLTTLQVGWVAYDLVYVPIRTFVFFAFMAGFFGVEFELAGTGPTLAFIVAFLPFVWGVGVASAAATLIFRRGVLANGVLGFGLTFLSGAYFPLDFFPGWVRTIAGFNPVALAVEGTRQALLGGAGWAELAPSIVGLSCLSLVALAIGSRVFAYAFRRELRSGGVGLY